jgi:hypothetical protein
MDQTSLVMNETSAGAEFLRRLNQTIPVKAALWVKDGDDGPWYLYVASDRIRDDTVHAAYGDVLRVAAEVASPYFDPFQVKLIPTTDPLAQAALEMYREYPGLMPARLGATKFGESWVEGVYLYPPPLEATAP